MHIKICTHSLNRDKSHKGLLFMFIW